MTMMPTQTMDRKRLEELIAVERGYWWHVARRAL
jgi:hypothetical protein